MVDILHRIRLAELKNNTKKPEYWRNRVLLVQKGCPIGKEAVKATIRYNLNTPPEDRVDIVYVDTSWSFGKVFISGLNSEEPFLSSIIREYDNFRCPTLVFDGNIFQGSYDWEHFYYLLNELNNRLKDVLEV